MTTPRRRRAISLPEYCSPHAFVTPDGRYFVVKGRLWRMSNPELGADVRSEQVSRLMTARRDVKTALKSGSESQLKAARNRVDRAKIALGEHGSVWWSDGEPDLNRRLVKNTAYAAWFGSISKP